MTSFPTRVGIVGLGYVGLPLAAALGKVVPTTAFDINERRVKELQEGRDANGEVAPEALRSPLLSFTSNGADLAACDFVIVAVPTPVDGANRPDLTPLLSASRTVGKALRMRADQAAHATAQPRAPIVVYESTVYPGCTEEVCVPALEQASGLRHGAGFKVGYSPERINPGDTEHTLERVVKIVSGEDAETLDAVAELYGRVVKAGVHRAPDIKTAEAAKVIENTQRDLNIALMNELSVLFHKMGIDTLEVLRAAGTKWNFLPFRPGLVGGHCIPVDPYYLTHKAEQLGMHPQVILAGRRVNDRMGQFVAQETVKLLNKTGRKVQGARVLLLGATFKEDVADARSTRVVDIARELAEYGATIVAFDPLLGSHGVRALGLTPAEGSPFDDHAERYDAVIVAVAHKQFRQHPPARFAALVGPGGLVVDVKSILPRAEVERANATYWSL